MLTLPARVLLTCTALLGEDGGVRRVVVDDTTADIE